MLKKRIVSLLPSATEIVCSLGFADCLIGRSHECDYPPEARSLPICTKPRINVNAGSREIDREVKTLLREALSIYELNTEAIRALKPDLILTQAQCEVCAVSLAQVEAAVRDWAGCEAEIVSLSPNCLADIWQGILQVAQALDVPDRGAKLVQALQERVADATRFSKPKRLTVACLEWLDPLMVAGNWVPELVDLAGGQDMFGKAGRHSDWIESKDLIRVDPEILILMPCGFDLERTRREMSILREMPEWNQLRAVQSGQVFVTDGSQFFNRPGPRVVESLEILIEILHPTQRRFGHEGKAWLRALC
jgi:iron complex transport system substrate-binding protein